MLLEKQEIHCHNCNHYVQFDLDIEGDGNYIIECPECGHKHYRVVRDKKVTDERWGSSNTGWVTLNTGNYTLSATTNSTFSNYNGTQSGVTGNGSLNFFLYNSWMNTTSASASNGWVVSGTIAVV